MGATQESFIWNFKSRKSQQMPLTLYHPEHIEKQNKRLERLYNMYEMWLVNNTYETFKKAEHEFNEFDLNEGKN